MGRSRNLSRTSDKIFDTVNVSVMLILSAITLFPFLNVLALSFNDGTDASKGGITIFPRVFSLDNYKIVLQSDQIINAGFITISRTVTGLLISLLVTSLAAYAFSKKHLLGRSAMLIFLTIPMFIGGSVISVFIVMHDLHLLNKFWVYILPGAFNFYYMIIIRTYFGNIPASIEESSKIDGASDLSIFIRIMLPISVPCLAAIALFIGVGHWNDFYSNLLFVSKRNLQTLQFILMKIIRQQDVRSFTDMLQNFNPGEFKKMQPTPTSVKNAAIVVTVFPIIALYPFLQRFFIKGIMIGSVKG
jgi:putative aldouronate transport system permease protein